MSRNVGVHMIEYKSIGNVGVDERWCVLAGLSLRVGPWVVDLDRDSRRKVATVRVRADPGAYRQGTRGYRRMDLAHATDLLAARAVRFLGLGWRVVGWSGYTEYTDTPTTGIHGLSLSQAS